MREEDEEDLFPRGALGYSRAIKPAGFIWLGMGSEALSLALARICPQGYDSHSLKLGGGRVHRAWS